MTDTLPSAAVGRELGGCPVMHRDFSRAQAAGCHWEQADELRESQPALLQHASRRATGCSRATTRSATSTRTRTSSRARRSRRGSRTRSTGSCRRRSTRPTTSSTGASSTRGSRRSAMDAAEPRMRDLCRRLVEDVAPSGGCDFVTGFALRFPTEAFLSMIGVDPADADIFVPWVEDFFGGFGGDPDGVEAMATALSGHPRLLGRRARRAARRARAADGRPRHAPAPRDRRRRAARRTPRCSTC